MVLWVIVNPLVMLVIFIASVVQQVVEPLQYDAYINVSADTPTCDLLHLPNAVHVTWTDISLHPQAPPGFPFLAIHTASDRKLGGAWEQNEASKTLYVV